MQEEGKSLNGMGKEEEDGPGRGRVLQMQIFALPLQASVEGSEVQFLH